MSGAEIKILFRPSLDAKERVVQISGSPHHTVAAPSSGASLQWIISNMFSWWVLLKIYFSTCVCNLALLLSWLWFGCLLWDLILSRNIQSELCCKLAQSSTDMYGHFPDLVRLRTEKAVCSNNQNLSFFVLNFKLTFSCYWSCPIRSLLRQYSDTLASIFCALCFPPLLNSRCTRSLEPDYHLSHSKSRAKWKPLLPNGLALPLLRSCWEALTIWLFWVLSSSLPVEDVPEMLVSCFAMAWCTPEHVIDGATLFLFG